MNKHTPGPWTAIDFREHHIISDSYDGSICFVYPKRGVPNEANAHLIAAAPELLAALEACEQSISANLHLHHTAAVAARAAIAKAKGQK